MSSNQIYPKIVAALEAEGAKSPYKTDANETDPRYKAYGVRMPARKAIFKAHRPAIRKLPQAEQINLAERLIQSGWGEQQTMGLYILQPLTKHFMPDTFERVDGWIHLLHGWSKVDEFSGTFLRDILFAHPDDLLVWVKKWNQEPDMWLRRMSVVIFTRKVAKSGQFTDIALEMCDNLIHAEEDLVQKGVGWALKDLMKADKDRILDYVRQLRRDKISSTITLYAIRDLKGQERKDFLESV
ncbi:MAG: DNA alkylation repair protein [Chloroflexota bacterium]